MISALMDRRQYIWAKTSKDPADATIISKAVAAVMMNMNTAAAAVMMTMSTNMAAAAMKTMRRSMAAAVAVLVDMNMATMDRIRRNCCA